jgi:hypothetical protein
MELWMIGTIVAIYLVIGAFVVGNKDGSARAIGLVAPAVAVCAITWFLNTGIDVAGLIVSVVALVLFLIGLNRPDDRDDIWHYLALAVALLGELVIWLLVVLGTQSVTVPVLLIVIVGAILVVATLVWLLRRKPRRITQPAVNHN